MIFIALLLFICFVLLFDYYLHHGKNGSLINQIPGPVTVPIFGNIIGFMNTPNLIWKHMRNVCKDYLPIFRLWFIFVPNIIIAHPDYIETVISTTKHIKKGDMYRLLHPWMGSGLLTSTGTKWHSRRKILTPAFHFNILRQFVDMIISEGECMMKSLKNDKKTIVVDIVPLISKYTLNAICETAMGTSLQDLGDFQKKYRQAIYKIGECLVYRLGRAWLLYEWLFLLTRMGRVQAKNLKIVHGFSEKIIAERKLYHKSTGNIHLKNFDTDLKTNNEDEMGTGFISCFVIDTTSFDLVKKKRLAMLDLLIAASYENDISDKDIREEVDTFMFEGHDTIAMGITFALFLFAKHKNIQDNIRTEVNSVMQETEGKLTQTSLQNLPYLERCLKEALRLYPSVPFISRIISEDVKLGSYTVPAGTNVAIDIFDLHKNPEFWPNPDVFDADRFLPEKMQIRHPYSYLPFSGGPRNCIGQRYAFIEMKAMIAPLVHNFYLELADYSEDVTIKSDLVLRPAHPIYIRFIPIENM